MSDNIRRSRALQRAKTAERVTRAAAERAIWELREFLDRSKDGLARGDGLHDAVDIDEFDLLAAEARRTIIDHRAEYALVASFEGEVNP